MIQRIHGITRTVLVTDNYAIKVPSLHHRLLVRGWLANRSEWKQSWRTDVHPPLYTLGHVVTVYRAALTLDGLDSSTAPWQDIPPRYTGDEAKRSSWGVVAGRLALIDYDRAWEDPRGIIGGVYYWRQERLARKWARL